MRKGRREVKTDKSNRWVDFVLGALEHAVGHVLGAGLLLLVVYLIKILLDYLLH